MTFTYDLEMWFNIPAHKKALFVKYEGNRAKGESQVYIYICSEQNVLHCLI